MASGVDFGKLFNQAQHRSSKRESVPAPSSSKRDGKRKAAKCPAGTASSVKQKKRKPGTSPSPASHSETAPERTLGATSRAPAKGGGLREKMQSQLLGARFRDINQQLYTRDSADAEQLFRREPELFQAYHEGFRMQSNRWPARPIDAIISWLQKQPTNWAVADMGCGDAEIALRVPQQVHSFDLLSTNERVTACDVAHVPLKDASLDVVVFCLSLMGANYIDFLHEAHRLLRAKGLLRVAEVLSRYEEGTRSWMTMLCSLGFDVLEHDESNSHFVHFLFVKSKRPPRHVDPIPLKPCLYKRR